MQKPRVRLYTTIAGDPLRNEAVKHAASAVLIADDGWIAEWNMDKDEAESLNLTYTNVIEEKAEI